MILSKKGIEFIKREELLRLHCYRDAVGVLTIGYGHTGSDVKAGQVITADQAEHLLLSDTLKAQAMVTKCVLKPLTQNQFDALVSFTFNVGTGGFSGSTLLRLINVNPNDQGIKEQFSRWVFGTVDGQRVKLPGLIARRNREAGLYFS